MSLGVEFGVKTDSGYPKDAGVIIKFKKNLSFGRAILFLFLLAALTFGSFKF